MKNFFSQLRALHASYRSAPNGSVIERARLALFKTIYQPNRDIFANALNRLDRIVGPKTVNRLYWYIPMLPKPWYITERRIFDLAKRPGKALEDFATLAFRRSEDPITLTSLARSSLTSAAVFAALNSEDTRSGSRLDQRVRTSVPTAYAIAAIAKWHEDPKISLALSELVDRHIDVKSMKLKSFIASFGYRPSHPENLASAVLLPSEHRLIIAENTDDKASLSMLFGTAEKVSLYSYKDMFGKVNFSEDKQHAHPQQLIIEHARTRITRFSADYHILHDQAQKVAQELAKEINNLSAHAPLLGENKPFAEMVFADDLFFLSIRIAAISKLLESNEFDHVVIAMQDGPRAAAFLQLISALPAISKDPRIEVISVSKTQTGRTKFLENWTSSQKPRVLPQAKPVSTKVVNIAAQNLKKYCADRIDGFPEPYKTADNAVLFLASPIGAYVNSAARFFAILNKSFQLRTVLMGGSTENFKKQIKDIGCEYDPDQLRGIVLSTKPSSNILRDVLHQAVVKILPRIDAPVIRNILDAGGLAFVETTVLSYLTFYGRCEQWFEKLKSDNLLPRVIVISPVRNMFLSSFIALARRENIPTIALEPHGLNASYCRYSTVFSDYYGVIASHFKEEAANGFEIPADRCPVVGSPRLIAPNPYDALAAGAAARVRLSDQFGLDFSKYANTFTFMSQPSYWGQMSEVWRIILRSTKGLNIQILLKTHPEEAQTRVKLFLQLAAQEGAADRVHHIATDPVTAIEASDMVLSGYSATVVESVLLRRPVACVINGKNNYPLDQHRVVGAPLWRGIKEMRAAILEFQADPSPYVTRAEAFLESEPQFIEGPDDRVKELVKQVMAMDPADAIRPSSELPQSSFLRGPFQVFLV